MFYFLMLCIGFKMYLFTCYEQVDGFVNRRVFKTLSIAADLFFSVIIVLTIKSF